MLKIKERMQDFLTANVKPRFLSSVVQDLRNLVKSNRSGLYTLRDFQSIYNKELEFVVSIIDFENVEDLVPYKWYTPDFFDGNPNEYWLIERCADGTLFDSTDPDDLNCLVESTTHFMYIEPVELSK